MGIAADCVASSHAPHVLGITLLLGAFRTLGSGGLGGRERSGSGRGMKEGYCQKPRCEASVQKVARQRGWNTQLTERELAILKRNLHGCYSRVPRSTDFLEGFIVDSIKFAHGESWSRLRAERPVRGRANQWMWTEWRAYDRFQKLLTRLKRYDPLSPVRMAQLAACCKMASKQKRCLEAKRPFPASVSMSSTFSSADVRMRWPAV
jgi:hypothetical protein